MPSFRRFLKAFVFLVLLSILHLRFLLFFGQLNQLCAIQLEALCVDNVFARGGHVKLMQSRKEVLHNRVRQVLSHQVLVDPEMSDEDAFAATTIRSLGCAIGLDAGENANIIRAIIVVPQVIAECSLLVGPVLLPPCATLVFCLRGALGPRLVHLLCALTLTSNDKAGVEIAIASVVIVLWLVGVDGHHGEGVVGHVPVVEQPLERKVRVVKHDVRIHEDDVVVGLESLLHHRHLDPGTPAVGVVWGANKSIIVTVDACCYASERGRPTKGILLTEHIMAEHARREGAHPFPLQLLVHDLALARERPAVDIQNKHLLPQLLCVLGLAWQAVHVAILVGEVRGVNRMQDRAIEGFKYGGHARVFFGDRGILRGGKSVGRLRLAQIHGGEVYKSAHSICGSVALLALDV